MSCLIGDESSKTLEPKNPLRTTLSISVHPSRSRFFQLPACFVLCSWLFCGVPPPPFLRIPFQRGKGKWGWELHTREHTEHWPSHSRTRATAPWYLAGSAYLDRNVFSQKGAPERTYYFYSMEGGSYCNRVTYTNATIDTFRTLERMRRWKGKKEIGLTKAQKM